MSRITFTPEQVADLKANPYVQSASEKSITHSDEFKRHFMSESLKGSMPSKSSRKQAFL